MDLNITPILPHQYRSSNSFESQIRAALKSEYAEAAPSRKAISTVLGFAASYECIDSRIGNIDVILN